MVVVVVVVVAVVMPAAVRKGLAVRYVPVALLRLVWSLAEAAA